VAIPILVFAALAAFQGPEGFNYEESKVPAYTLPDPLLFSDGVRIASARQWPERRQQILRLFESQMYGRSPGPPKEMTFETFEQSGNALNGLATRKQIAVYFDRRKSVRMDILLYLPKERPKDAKGRTPLFLGLNFYGNHAIAADPAIRVTESWMRENAQMGIVNHRATEKSRGTNASQWQVEKILRAGFGVATFYYGDVDPDYENFDDGVHKLYYKPGQTRPEPDEWGSVAAWAWGASRALDYLQTNREVDARARGAHRTFASGQGRAVGRSAGHAVCDDRLERVRRRRSGHRPPLVRRDDHPHQHVFSALVLPELPAVQRQRVEDAFRSAHVGLLACAASGLYRERGGRSVVGSHGRVPIG
jgi:hypothetical protein